MTRPVPLRNLKRRAASTQPRKPAVSGDLAELCRQLEQVEQRAEALGISTDDRELLECPNCGLLEDVTSEGLLITYPKDSVDLKDCGLRFRPEGKTNFACPSCGTRIKAVIS